MQPSFLLVGVVGVYRAEALWTQWSLWSCPLCQDGILKTAETYVREEKVNLLVIDPYNFIERSQEGRGGDENVGRGHTLGTGFGNCLWFGDLTWMLTENERPGIQQGNGWRSSFHFWDGFQVVKMFIFQGVDVFFSFFWGGTFWIFIVTSCLFTSQGIPLEKAGSWLDIMNTRKLVNDQSFPFYAQLFGPPGSTKITGQAVVS